MEFNEKNESERHRLFEVRRVEVGRSMETSCNVKSTITRYRSLSLAHQNGNEVTKMEY